MSGKRNLTALPSVMRTGEGKDAEFRKTAKEAWQSQTAKQLGSRISVYYASQKDELEGFLYAAEIGRNPVNEESR